MSVTTFSASLDEANEFVCTDEGGYTGEHNAQLLEITLNEEFASAAYDYITVAFDTGIRGGKSVSNEVRDSDDAPVYRIDNKIYCPLTQSLTASGKLRLQLSAHSVESLQVTNIRKSGILEIEFLPSVMGEESALDCNAQLVARIYAAITQLGELASSITTLEQSLQTQVAALEGDIAALDAGQQAHGAANAQTQADITAIEGDITQLESAIEGIQADLAELDGAQAITAGSYLQLVDGVMSVKTRNSVFGVGDSYPTPDAIGNYVDSASVTSLAAKGDAVTATVVAMLIKSIDSACVSVYYGVTSNVLTRVRGESMVESILGTQDYFLIVPYTDHENGTVFSMENDYLAGSIYKVAYDEVTDFESITRYTQADFGTLLGLGA